MAEVSPIYVCVFHIFVNSTQIWYEWNSIHATIYMCDGMHRRFEVMVCDFCIVRSIAFCCECERIKNERKIERDVESRKSSQLRLHTNHFRVNLLRMLFTFYPYRTTVVHSSANAFRIAGDFADVVVIFFILLYYHRKTTHTQFNLTQVKNYRG